MFGVSARPATPVSAGDGAHRPEVGRWALRRLVDPEITITEPPQSGVVVEHEVAVPMRDGVHLRVNIFRPDDSDEHPVLLCAHPYGKDKLPQRRRVGGGYKTPLLYHLMRSGPVTHSAWTTWEAPDPAYWVQRGYVVVNADLRGWGTSEGDKGILTEQEGLDGYDLVEWLAEQQWSNGRIGMSGVSYLAIIQWAVAAARPPHLAAICAWEGFTDAYRQFIRPGGVLEQGFWSIWSGNIKRGSHGSVDLGSQSASRPLFDDWWASLNRRLEDIDVPALICGSFSDHNLHTEGSFAAFARISSAQKWLYTHRAPKWTAYYSQDGLDAQARFFDHFLRGDDTGILDQAPVRLEVREDRETVTSVRDVASWPLPGTTWTTLHLAEDTTHPSTESGILQAEPAPPGQRRFDIRRGRATYTYRFSEDTDVVGPMLLRLTLSVHDADDMPVFAGVRKFRDGQEVAFHGSYGFDSDLVTHGILLASHRATSPTTAGENQVFHPHTSRQPLLPDIPVTLEMNLLPSATLFRTGEELRLDIQGRWFQHPDPITGHFPTRYPSPATGTVILHTGRTSTAELLIPVVRG